MRFEKLEVWRKSALLCADIYENLRELKDFTFKNQIFISALSISSNIAEGFERETVQECIRFLYYAKGSCGELRSQIYVGFKIKYIEKSLGKNWVTNAEEISYMLSSLIKTRCKFLTNNYPLILFSFYPFILLTF